MQSDFQVRKSPLLPSGGGGIYVRLSLHSFRTSGLSLCEKQGSREGPIKRRKGNARICGTRGEK